MVHVSTLIGTSLTYFSLILDLISDYYISGESSGFGLTKYSVSIAALTFSYLGLDGRLLQRGGK